MPDSLGEGYERLYLCEEPMTRLVRQAGAVMADLGLEPLEPSHEPSPASWVLHDLGMAGDEADAFWQALLERVPVRPLDGRCVPSEFSHDGYRVSMARSWLGRTLAGVRHSYVSQIERPPVTLASLLPDPSSTFDHWAPTWRAEYDWPMVLQDLRWALSPRASKVVDAHLGIV